MTAVGKKSIFSLRIVAVGFYMTKPTPNLDVTYSEFKQKEVTTIPVIRIFGATPLGQRACINVHGVFPYLMVPYCGPNLKFSEPAAIQQYLLQLACSLDHALNSSPAGKSKLIKEHVFKIVLVCAMPFYGFHAKEEAFMKIYFYFPSDIKRAAEMLQAGAVMNTSFQPHEAHIPFILQMFMDYNLYGMNILNARCCWFRKAIEKDERFAIVPKRIQPVKVQNLEVEKPSENAKIESDDVASDFKWNNFRSFKSTSTDEQSHHTSSEDIDGAANLHSFTDAQNNSLGCTSQCISFMCENFDDIKMSKVGPKSSSDFLHIDSLPSEAFLPVEIAPKQTSCELEVDILAADILNRSELELSTGRNPGIVSIWDDEKARRRQKTDSSLIELPLSTESRSKQLTKKEENFLKILNEFLNPRCSSVEDVSTFDKLKEGFHSCANEHPSFSGTAKSNTGMKIEDCKPVVDVNSPESAKSEDSFLAMSMETDLGVKLDGSFQRNRIHSRSFSFESSTPDDDSVLRMLTEMQDRSSRKRTSSNDSMPEQVTSSRGRSASLEDQLFSSRSKSMESAELILQQKMSPIVNETIVSQLISPEKQCIAENDERETNSSLATQHSNGLADEESDREDDVTLTATPRRSFNVSEMADEDTSDVMTQPWESGIEDLLVADPSNDSDDTVVSEQNKDVIESSQMSEPSFSTSSTKRKKNSLLPSTFHPTSVTERTDEYLHNRQLNTLKKPTRKRLKISRAKRISFGTGTSSSHFVSSTPKSIRTPVKRGDGLVVVKACPMPPTWDNAAKFLQETPSCFDNSSKEPFYSNSSDAQNSASRFQTPHIRGFVHGKQMLKEFISTHFLCGLHHWKLVSSSFPLYQLSDAILELPALRQGTIIKHNIIVIKPFKNPPPPAKVWDRIQKQQKYQIDSDKSLRKHLVSKNEVSTSVQHSSFKVSSLFEKEENKKQSQKTDIRSVDSQTQQRLASSTAHSSNLKATFRQRKKLSPSPTSSVPLEPSISACGGLCYDDLIPSNQQPDASSRLSLHSINTSNPGFDSRVVGVTQNTFGFRAQQQDLAEAKSVQEQQHLVLMSVELHIRTRLDLCPDPEIDEIRALFYAVQYDVGDTVLSGCFIVDAEATCHHSPGVCGITNLKVVYVASEHELFNHLSTFILHVDPDILLGYEVQMKSWGFLLSRADQLGYDLCRYISRAPDDAMNSWCNAEKDEFGADNASEIHIVGRLVLNVWRLMRSEVALYDYKFESVAYHLLHQRHPYYSPRTLTLWFDQPHSSLTNRYHESHTRARAIKYYMCRVLGNLKLISQQDIVGRTSELARLFGIQFYEVLTRGSQYRVESMMLRQAHSLNYTAVSPSALQRAGQKAPEIIALVMEPESRFYSEPVIVVDFQSLYPSVIIAYNYCFSTCLGRVECLKTPGATPFGCTLLDVPIKTVKHLLQQDAIHVAPNGVAYVKTNVRLGVLPAMLEEILNTRIMVKDSIKKCNDRATKTMLDHRQLGLKLIANVTYGYTSASFSGRMPCVEIADSIVHKARETLERAIELVHANYPKWQARVVYGDTDSMFIALEKGTNRKKAFRVAREIVDAVTKSNPRPVKLKFEKIYQPCILQTKKRYVGYAYESEDQEEAIFDAKGIETVRRDGCPAVAKILEKTLRVLFDSRDLSKVKEYVSSQCSKILNDGKSTLQDCIIAKEYRGAKYYKQGVVVPALVLARKGLAADKRSEPRVGERVPYVVVHGAPGTPLYQLIRRPQDVLLDPNLKLNGTYYVTKMVLPALDRIMSLLGIDVFRWYQQLPRELRICSRSEIDFTVEEETKSKKATLSQYFGSRHCVCCKSICTGAICSQCLCSTRSRQHCAVKLATQVQLADRTLCNMYKVCLSCCNVASSNDIKCENMDCPVMYKRVRAQNEATSANGLRFIMSSNHLF